MTTPDHDRVQRWASILVGSAAVALVGVLTFQQTTTPRHAGGDAGSEASSFADESHGADAGATSEDLDAALPSFALDLGDGSAGLPDGAPRSVKIGVVLVEWKGAEGASTSARSKTDALARARTLAAEAKTDFHHAVAGGDPGSAEDIGRLPRGTLEPQTEAVIFALSPGEISDVVETPRGYWIVKRID